MSLRIYGRGLSPNGVEYTASIFDKDWGGASTLVDLMKDGIKIEYASEKDDDPMQPIMGSVCTIEMLAESDNSTHTTFLDDLRTSKEGRFYVEVTANGGNYSTLWRGIVTPDTLTNEQDNSPRYTVSITAVCGLALLKTVPYLSGGTALYTGREKLVAHLCKALTKLAHVSDLWAVGDDFIETSADWWEVTMTRGGANDPFNLSFVDHAAWYDYFTKGSIDKDVISCYDVIKHIVSSFGCRILQRGGMFVVEQLDYRTNTSYEYRRYDKAGTATSNSSHTGAQTINQTLSSGSKVSFVESDYIPQVTKARVTYESRLRRNFWGNIILSEGTTFNFDQDISSNSGAVTFRIRGLFFINIKNNTYSGNPQDILIPEIRIMLKIGSSYLKRTVSFANFAAHYSTTSWTSTNSDRLSLVPSGQQVPASGLSIQYVAPLDFITPPLPADGSVNQVSATFFQLKKNDGSDVDESQFTITWTGGSMFLEVYDSGTPDVYEDEVLYEATNPDEGTEIWETTVRLGGGGTPNYAGRLTGTGGAELALWGQGTGTRDKALGSVLAKRAVDGRLRPKKRLNGEIYANNIDPRKLLSTSEGIDWLHTRITWRPTENRINGTWVEMDYGTTGSPATPIKVKIIKGPNTPPIIGPLTPVSTTGGGNQGFASNNPPAVLQPLAFNTLATAITKGATITSIAVNTALEGNEFLAGDNIVIVHPVSGQYQAFAVSSAPGAGATSISVTSEVADFDVPQYAGLFIQQKAYAFSLPPGTHEGSILRWDGVNEIWEPYDGGTDGHVLTWDTTNGWQAEASSGGGLADGDKGDITVSGGGTVWTIDNNVVSDAKLRDSAASSVIGRAGLTGGDPADIVATTSGHVLRMTDAGLAFTTVSTTGIADDAVTDAKLRNSVGLSVIGRSANTTGDPADIAAANDFEVLRRSGTTLGFGQVATGGIADSAVTTAKINNDAVTYAKIQNVSTNNRLLGRATAGAGDVEEITLGTGLSFTGTTLNVSGFVDGTGVSNRLAYWSDTDTIASDAAFFIDAVNDRMTVSATVASTTAGQAWLNLRSGSITGSTYGLYIDGNLSANLGAKIENARNLAGASASLDISVGGTSAGDPYLLFVIPSGTNTVLGPDNSDSDKFKVTPGGTAPGSTADKGLILTTDAITKVGINKDVPKHELQVRGRIMADTGFIGKGVSWNSGLIAFGTGAGTGGSLLVNSITGCNNWMYISFTTGNSPTANGTIFTATYPNAFPASWAASFVTWSPFNANAATDITKFRGGNRTNVNFTLVANGTLTANTNYQLCFQIGSMDS